MATLPAFFRRTVEAEQPVRTKPDVRPDAAARPQAAARTVRVQAKRDPFQLRALPNDDIFFYCKKIDNFRLVREADPQARGACWSAIGAACVLVVLMTSAFFPTVATTLAGYKLEALRIEERHLLAERRGLDLQEAELLSPARLDKLAKENNLVTPSSGQVVHLNGNSDDAVAMIQE